MSETPPDDEQPPEESPEPQPGQDLPPLGEGMQEPEPGPMPEEEHDPWWGLRNSEPPVSPQEVGAELDLDAKWYEHLACGFIKQTGSSGAEAWMHYAMGGMLFVIEMYAEEEAERGAGGSEGELLHADAGEPDENMGEGEGMSPDEFLS